MGKTAKKKQQLPLEQSSGTVISLSTRIASKKYQERENANIRFLILDYVGKRAGGTCNDHFLSRWLDTLAIVMNRADLMDHVFWLADLALVKAEQITDAPDSINYSITITSRGVELLEGRIFVHGVEPL